MPSPNETFTEMVSTTLRHVSSKMTDNVSNHNALLRRMKEKSKIKTVSGGYEIQEPLEYAENGTYQRYAGYDSLNTQASDVITSAKFEWQQIALHVTGSGKEIRMNAASKERMTNLVNTRVGNAKRTAQNNMSIDVYSDGSLTNQINGLANLVQTDGLGTVGGINASTWDFWRNKIKEMTGTNLAATPNATNAASLKADMNSHWLSLNRGTDKPDLIVATHDLYTLYETGEQQLQRYSDADMANAGFNGLKYKTADIIFDDNTNFGTTDEKMYFLNTDYIYLFQHKDAQWTQDDSKTPVNQDAVVIPMYWMGNMAVTNRSLQGVLFDAA